MAWRCSDSKIIREMILKEAELFNHRMTWLVTLQGLLFTALGFAWGNGRDLVYVFASLGVAVAGSIRFLLLLGRGAAEDLERKWELNKPEDYEGPPIVGRGHMAHWTSFLLPWSLIPLLFIVAWVSVLVINYCRP